MRMRELPWLAGALAGAWLALAPALAQEDMPERVRGTLVDVEGDTLVVETRAGEVMGFRLKEGAGIFTVTPARLEDLKAGDFVGLTSIESGGQRVALEAHRFAEDLRGTGEGHFAWDLVQEPNTMTNATVAEIEEVGRDRRLTVTYEGGEQTIALSPGVPVVELAKVDDRSLLTPGQEVFLMVEAPPDGMPEAVAVAVGREGAAPPM